MTGSWGLFFNITFLALAGAFNCGPDSILGKFIIIRKACKRKPARLIFYLSTKTHSGASRVAKWLALPTLDHKLQILLEAEFSSWLYSALLHKSFPHHPSFVSIWLKIMLKHQTLIIEVLGKLCKPLKPLGQFSPYFIWILFRPGEQKFIWIVALSWPRWLPCPYLKNYLTLSTLGKIFSRRHFEIFFLFFPENRIWHFMQIVS